jgi:isoquinoline 1-oxidoreductase beta subunit
MKRRTLIFSTAGAAGALVVGWSLMPPRQRLATATPRPATDQRMPLNGWVGIGADDRVVVAMPKSEMGQGTHTGLAMLVAEELDADWSRVQIEPSTIDGIYFNQATVVDALPFHPDDEGALKQLAGWLTAKSMREVGLMVTGGSSSIKDLWLPMRQAGASARAMLVSAAAQAWGVAQAEVRVADGVLSHASGRQARMSEFAAAAASMAMPSDPLLKTPAQFKLIGRPKPRLEAAAKSRGEAVFGLDVQPPGLRYASIRMCPTLGGQVATFDAEPALGLPGVKRVLAVPGFHGGTAGVATIADTPWHALNALEKVRITWDEKVPAAAFSSAQAMERLTQTLDQDDGFAFHRTGDVEAALKGAARTLTAEYRAPWLAHATLEPQNCTVQLKDGKATVWAPTQVPDLARRVAASVLGIPTDHVEVQVPLLGGGFGRRLDVDFIAQAAFIALAGDGWPVQTFWTRAEDTAHDFYRPAAVSRFKAGLNAAGQLVAWHNVSAGQAVTPQIMGRLFGLPGAGPDKTTAEGAFDQAYEWPNARIAHAAVDLPMPVGFWRSVGHSHQAFFKECFLDEVAAAVGQDPVAFRMALLQRHPRHQAVLGRVAALAGWGQPLLQAPGGGRRALGVALHQSFGSIVGQVAEVSLAADRAIRVHRVSCVIDCGTAVNPNLVRQQMEGAVVVGLSAALYGRITAENGRVQQSNFHDYPVLRMDACPVIDTEIIASSQPPQGVGEPGTPPIAPAVANALFALTGHRLRALPLEAG